MGIVDNDKLCFLLTEYSTSHDEDIFADIIESLTPLINFMISMYNPPDPDDMRQEVHIKIFKSSDKYDESKGSPHTFYSRVIRNACISTYHKDSKHDDLYELDDECSGGSDIIDRNVNYDILLEVIQRNIERFPSLEPIEVEEITIYIYYSICNGMNKVRSIIRQISNSYCVSFSKP